MIKRFGSTGLATILGIGGLLAVGVGSFAAYKSYTGGCGACCASKDAVATPAVLTEGTDSCCSADKAAHAEKASCASSCEGEAKAACATTEGCCKGKDAAECCKSGEAAAEGSGCSEKATECTGEKAEPTAAADKKSCPLCPSKANG